METEKVEQGFPAEEGKEEGTTSVPLEMTEGDSFLVRTGTANPSIGVAAKRWGENNGVHMVCEELTDNGKRIVYRVFHMGEMSAEDKAALEEKRKDHAAKAAA